MITFEWKLTPFGWISLFWLIIALIILALVAYATYGPKKKEVTHGA